MTDRQDYQTGSGNVVWKALGSSFTPSEMVKISPITFLFLLLKNMECEEDKKKKKIQAGEAAGVTDNIWPLGQ